MNTTLISRGYGQLRSLLKKDTFWKYINLIILIIINLMCFSLMLYENFWYDEAYTIGMIQRDFKDIIHITSQDVHSPLYYFLLKVFYIFPGMENLLSVKVFSWLFYLAYLLLGSYICRKHYSRRVEFYWLIVSGFMSPMIVQSTSPRMYTLAVFCMTLSLYLAYLAVKRDKVRYWIGFVIVSAITMWIHTFCMIEMFVLYGFLVIWTLVKKRYKMLGKVLLGGVGVSAAYVPWLVILWQQFRRWAGWEDGWSNTIVEFGSEAVKIYLGEWFSSGETPNQKVIVLCMIALIIASLSAVHYMVKKKDWLLCVGLVFSGIVVTAAIIVSVTIVPCFLGRYIFPLFGAIYLMVAVGVENLRPSILKLICVFVIVGCGLVTYSGELKVENPGGLQSYRIYMNSNVESDDLIMADSYILMMMSIYCPENEYMVYGYVPPCLPFEGCQAFKKWEQLEEEDVVWYLSLKNFRRGNLDEKFEVVERQEIRFYYYDIVIEKYVKKE